MPAFPVSELLSSGLLIKDVAHWIQWLEKQNSQISSVHGNLVKKKIKPKSKLPIVSTFFGPHPYPPPSETAVPVKRLGPTEHAAQRARRTNEPKRVVYRDQQNLSLGATVLSEENKKRDILMPKPYLWLHGPPGTGKHSLICSLLKTHKFKIHTLTSSEFVNIKIMANNKLEPHSAYIIRLPEQSTRLYYLKIVLEKLKTKIVYSNPIILLSYFNWHKDLPLNLLTKLEVPSVEVSRARTFALEQLRQKGVIANLIALRCHITTPVNLWKVKQVIDSCAVLKTVPTDLAHSSIDVTTPSASEVLVTLSKRKITEARYLLELMSTDFSIRELLSRSVLMVASHNDVGRRSFAKVVRNASKASHIFSKSYLSQSNRDIIKALALTVPYSIDRLNVLINSLPFGDPQIASYYRQQSNLEIYKKHTPLTVGAEPHAHSTTYKLMTPTLTSIAINQAYTSILNGERHYLSSQFSALRRCGVKYDTESGQFSFPLLAPIPEEVLDQARVLTEKNYKSKAPVAVKLMPENDHEQLKHSTSIYITLVDGVTKAVKKPVSLDSLLEWPIVNVSEIIKEIPKSKSS